MKHTLIRSLIFPIILSAAIVISCEKINNCNTGTLTIRNTRSETINVTVAGEGKSIEPSNAVTFQNVPDHTCEVTVICGSKTYTNVTFGTCVGSCQDISFQY